MSGRVWKIARSFALLFSAFYPCQVQAQVSHIQQSSNTDVSGATYKSFGATFPSAATNGNAILIGVSFGNTNPTITATDSQGNSYTQAIKTYDSRHRQGCAILYATNIRGGAPVTVTVSFSSAVAYLALGVHEYAGIVPAAALDKAAGAVGSGPTLSSGAATTTANGDLIFSVAVEDSVGRGDVFTPGSGYIKRVDLGNVAAHADEDMVQTSAGSIAGSWTMARSGEDWIADMAAFKSSSGAAGTTATITNLSPASGAVGTPMTIAGFNFGASQGASTITFNGTTAAPTSWSATNIVASVPVGATTGNVVVTVGGQLSNTMSFTVTPTAPAITSLSPTSGLVGTPVTIAGTNFGSTKGMSTVKFNGTTATPASWTSTSIVAPVPSGATTGNVVVQVGTQTSNGMSFTVLAPPRITSLSPASGAVATLVTITGTNFGATQGTSTVSFSGASGVPGSWNATSIVVPVPSGATTGGVTVTVAGQSSNSVSFTVTVPPSITSISPTSGVVGTQVTITGANFGATQGTSTVRFNGTAATPASWSATTIIAPAPSGATTGNVVVTVAGQASNGVSFTVPPPPISVSVSPPSPTVVVNSPQTFAANVQNDPLSQGVTWSISGAGCLGATCGALTNVTATSVTYTAPAAVPSPATVTLSATSVADVTKTAGASITVTAALPPTVIKLVQTAGTNDNSSASFVSQAFTSANVAGNLIVVVASWGDNPATSINALDTLGNTYSLATNDFDPGNREGLAILYAPNIRSGANTVTVNFGQPDGYRYIIVSEYSGLAASSPVDKAAKQQAWATTASNNVSSTGGTTATSGDLIFGAVVDDSGPFGTITAGTGFTRRAFLNNMEMATEDAVQTAAGPIAATFTFSQPDHYLAQMVAFRAGASGTGGGIGLSLACTSTTLSLGQSSACTVTLTQSAPAGGLGVSLSSSSSALTVPGSVTVPAGSNSASFSATAGSVAANQTVTVTATSIADATKTSTTTIVVVSPVISVSISPSSPSVQVNTSQSFTATVLNDAQNKGVTWSLSGAGCTGGGCGTLADIATTSVTYTAPAAVPNPPVVTLTATSLADSGRSAADSITILASGTIRVAASPKRAALTTAQAQQFTPNVTGTANPGVNWFVDGVQGGNATVGTISTGGLYTPGSSAGRHSVTASSVVDGTTSQPSTVAVTDLTGVFTWRNDNTRAGVNSQEYALDTATVSSAAFGKLFSCPVDGFVYAQPLYVANLLIPKDGKKHNVIIAATENASLYAFDADDPACNAVWQTASVSLVPAGESVVIGADVGSDTTGPLLGITGTPVIDSGTNTLYVVARSKDATSLFQRLQAIDITTGQPKTAPVVIAASVPGNGSGSMGGMISFDPQRNHQRPGLLLANGVVYVSWASHDDLPIYHGWVIGFNKTTLQMVSAFSTTPNGTFSQRGEGGIWMSGAAPAADSRGNIYVSAGNGTFGDTSSTVPPVAPNNDFGDSVLKLSSTLAVSDFFTPFDQNTLSNLDIDLGSTGVILLPDLTGAAPMHLALCGGKSGKIYLMDGDNLGRFQSVADAVVQVFQLSSDTSEGFRSTPAFFNNTLYAAGQGDPLMALNFDPNPRKFNGNPPSPSSQSGNIHQGYGTTPSVSAQSTSNAIIWTIDVGPVANAPAVPAILRAYDATDLTKLLYRSDAKAGDAAGRAVKFTVPTVANGKVYVGTQTELTVYGLLPN